MEERDRGRAGQGRGSAWGEVEALLLDLLDTVGTDVSCADTECADRVAEAVALCRNRLAEIREAARERDRRLRRLRTEKEEVLGVVAHDLRTPLVAIQGFAQLLRRTAREDGLSPRQAEYVDRILQATAAMNRLVEDLLTARRLDQGTLPFRPRPVDVAGFLDDLLAVHREAARQKGVSVRVEVPGAVPEVRLDPDRLGQALGNMIQNAVRFTPAGGEVGVRVRQARDGLEFSVYDQGPGIDEDLLPRLFHEETRRSLADTAGPGYGLGLAICRDIAALHGGTVGAENLPGGGSRFWLQLPAGRTGGDDGPPA